MGLKSFSDSSVCLFCKLDSERATPEKLPCRVYFSEPLPITLILHDYTSNPPLLLSLHLSCDITPSITQNVQEIKRLKLKRIKKAEDHT